MLSRISLALILVPLLSLASCSSDEGHDDARAPNPAPPKENVCPVGELSRESLQSLVNRVKASHDETIGWQTAARAGLLAAELASAGVTEAAMKQAITNGKFAALTTWLSDDIKTVDLNKFSNCEEN